MRRLSRPLIRPYPSFLDSARGRRSLALLYSTSLLSQEVTMPGRDAAWDLLCEFTASDSLRKHALAVEACVRAYARKFGDDEELWGLAGLLHDFDYERWPNNGHHPTQE